MKSSLPATVACRRFNRAKVAGFVVEKLQAVPRFLEGPAWLPNDREAYIIVSSFDAADAPDYPVGLYRASSNGRSLERILADEGFEDVEWIDRVTLFSRTHVRPIAADGQRALVSSFTEGIQVLDLVTGARTSLGHDVDASAVWSSDGSRFLVGSSAGLFYYDADGSLLDTLAVGDIELGIFSPDDKRIVYRRRDEILLRVIDVIGGGDRVLASTDATPLFSETITIEGVDLEESVFLDRDTVRFSWFAQFEEEQAGPFLVDIDTGTLTETSSLGSSSADRRWHIEREAFVHEARRVGGREARPIIPTSLGGQSRVVVSGQQYQLSGQRQ